MMKIAITITETQALMPNSTKPSRITAASHMRLCENTALFLKKRNRAQRANRLTLASP